MTDSSVFFNKNVFFFKQHEVSSNCIYTGHRTVKIQIDNSILIYLKHSVMLYHQQIQ